MRKGDGPGGASTDEAGQGFYGRWSRRKQAAREVVPQADEPQPPPPLVDVEDQDTPVVVAEQEVDAPQLLTDEDMPALETLDEDSDFSGFLSEGVSEELRLKALRKLFLSPKFNVVDGLNDYDEDFTSFEALGDIVTSDMRHQRELEEQRRMAQEESAQASAAAREEGETPRTPPGPEEEDGTLASGQEGAAPAGEQVDEEVEGEVAHSQALDDARDSGTRGQGPAKDEDEAEDTDMHDPGEGDSPHGRT